MAAPDVTRAMRVKGRLCIDPTDFSTAWPHGGTGLGMVRDVAVRNGRMTEQITAEEFGVEVIDVIDLGESWVLAATLREWDADALAKVFPAGKAGATTTERVVEYPKSYRAGTLLSSSTVKLLFTPDDQTIHPAVLFYRALPLVEETAELSFQLGLDLVVPVMFVAIRDASANMVQVGLLEDLTV